MGTAQNLNYYKEALLLLIILTLILIIFVPFEPVVENIPFLRKRPPARACKCVKPDQKCDVSSGRWVPYPEGPYYTNDTECVMDTRQNCMKYGRADTEFMNWRWKPDECDLPLFDGRQFLELLRGKSMAFVGDSLARNQMQSLGCMLSAVARYTEEPNTHGEKYESWYYPDYNFTLKNFTSNHLVRAEGVDAFSEIPIDLYLDEADATWAAHIDKFDYVIISSGHWFSKKLMFHNKGKVVGCSLCDNQNVTDLNQYYGYKMAFETAFKTLNGLRNFKGRVFLRTISPTHYEIEKAEGVGFCPGKRPATKEETEFNWLIASYYMHQKEEFRVAKREGKRRGLKFDLLDITDAMMLRPDGHPNNYGQKNYGSKKRFNDCLHWCLPGPIDLWNELLFYLLKSEEQGER